MPRIMKTTVVDDKVVVVEGPHDSTTSQGTQEAQGIKKRPLFRPRKKKKSTTSYPKVHLTLKHKKGSEDFEEEPMEKDAPQKKASIEEECFEVEATEKDAAQNKASIEEEGFEVEATEKDAA